MKIFTTNKLSFYILYMLFVLSSCLSKGDKKGISCEEFHIDSLYLDSLRYDSLNAFVKQNVFSLTKYHGLNDTQIVQHHKEMEENHLSNFKISSLDIEQTYKSLNLRYYWAGDPAYGNEWLNYFILENTKSYYKSLLSLHNENTGLYSSENKVLFTQMDKYQCYDMIGFQRFLNNSDVNIEDIDIEELTNFFKHYLYARGTSPYSDKQRIRIKDIEDLEHMKDVFLKNHYYKKEVTEDMFNYLATLLDDEIVDNYHYKAINLIFKFGQMELIQIKAPKHLEHYKQYRFIVNHYTF